jgi:hypothetical protein
MSFMRRRLTVSVQCRYTALVLAATLFGAGSAPAQKLPPDAKGLPGTADLRRVDPPADDAPDPATPVGRIIVKPLERRPDDGAAVVGLTVDAPRGTRFFVQYQHFGVRGASGTSVVWEIGDAGPAEVRITFKYREGFAGDRTVNVMQTNEQDLTLLADAQGCLRPNIVSVVGTPLMNVPPGERAVVVPEGAELPLLADSPQAVLTVCKKEAEQDASKADPRSVLTVGLFRDRPKVQASVTEKLKSLWLGQRQEVGSARIKYRHLHQGDASLQPLKRDEVNAILTGAELDEHPDAFPNVARKLLARPEILDKPWSDGEFFCLGLKTRDNTDWYARLFDAELDLHFDFANSQIDVYHRHTSRVHRNTLNEFRILGNPLTDLASYEVKELPSGRVMLRQERDNSSNETLVDLATGFMRHTLTAIRGDLQVNEAFQYAPTPQPGGIMFPKLIVRTYYRKGDLDRLEMVMLERIELNENLPPDTFKLAVKKGAKVFIHGSDPVARPDYLQVQEDTTDVANLARAHEEAKLAAEPK